jgi:hypothetical protein
MDPEIFRRVALTIKPRTYADALDVLNARRAGMDMSEAVVLAALELTGDYVPQSRYQDKFIRLFEVAE